VLLYTEVTLDYGSGTLPNPRVGARPPKGMRAVLPAFTHAGSNSQLTGLVSGDPKKLKTLSQRYGVPHAYSYEQYEQCLREGDIDAVYIALPNSMHCDYMIYCESWYPCSCAKSYGCDRTRMPTNGQRCRTCEDEINDCLSAAFGGGKCKRCRTRSIQESLVSFECSMRRFLCTFGKEISD
jgi:hypothetical protein